MIFRFGLIPIIVFAIAPFTNLRGDFPEFPVVPHDFPKVTEAHIKQLSLPFSDITQKMLVQILLTAKDKRLKEAVIQRIPLWTQQARVYDSFKKSVTNNVKNTTDNYANMLAALTTMLGVQAPGNEWTINLNQMQEQINTDQNNIFSDPGISAREFENRWVPGLMLATEDEDPLIVIHAIDALGKLENFRSFHLLLQLLSNKGRRDNTAFGKAILCCQ